MTKRVDEDDRRQQQLRRLGTQNPCCVGCGELAAEVLELHHIAGRKRTDDVTIVCANCHRKLSNKQRSHTPKQSAEPTGQLGKIGHFLLGLADLLMLVVEALRKFGEWLVAESNHAAAA